MHFDRFSDVSRIIHANSKNLPTYTQFSSPDETNEIENIGLNHRPEVAVVPADSCKETGNRKSEPERECESGPLNYKEVKKVQELRVVEETKTKTRKQVEVIPEVEDIDNLVSSVSAEYDRKEEEMKDLDRLVNDLLQEASQIPDIPYHARVDGLPFRYCPEDDIVKTRSKLGGHGDGHGYALQPQPQFQPQHREVGRKISGGLEVEKEQLPQSRNWNNLNVEREPVPKPKTNTKSPLSVTSSSVGDGLSRTRNWSQVTVEHDHSPITWTQIPMTLENSSPHTPVVQERSSRRDNWNDFSVSSAREGQQSRDWNVFRDVRQKEQELELQEAEWTRSKGQGLSRSQSTPRKQMKYGRSISADSFSDQNSDEWLAKQMAKLQLKRTASIRQNHPLMNRSTEAPPPAWLVELKRRNSSVKNVASAPSNSSVQVEEQEQVRQVAVTEANVDPTNAGTPTPRFPACPPTPYMNKSGARKLVNQQHTTGKNTTTYSTKSAPVTDEDSEDEDEIAKIMFNRRQEEEMKFTVDTSSSWYKPGASREETISALANRGAGTFIIRNSNSFPGAYGLAIKVDDFNVRHFLIEPTRAGVRLRGSAIEPVFGSLSALVYAHTIQPLALPVKLKLHTEDNLIPTSLSQSTTSKLLSQGAACQLLFLGANNVEMLTGAEAIQRSIGNLHTTRPTLVNLRLSKGGLVLTDIMRENFFRNHYNLSSIIHAGIDPLNRSITVHGKLCRLFGIVVSSGRHNSVLVLSEYEEGQPAVAIVAFILRVIQWRSM